VGESTSKGVEALVEVSPLRFPGVDSKFNLRVFASYSYTDARYGNFKVISVDAVTNTLTETSYKNNKVENAPLNILRSGITGEYRSFSLTWQTSYVDKSYSDANNTRFDPVAVVGINPAYVVSDVTASVIIEEFIRVKAGINNIFNEKYITRRAPSIPGPGAMPADGRTFFVSVGARF
jgi:Fe(3+) dicitrate transport protein